MPGGTLGRIGGNYPIWVMDLPRLPLSRMKTAKTLGASPDNSARGSADNFTLSAHKDLGSNLTLHALLGRSLAEERAADGALTMRACCVPGWFQPSRACSTGCCRRVFDRSCAAPWPPRYTV